jgi:holo-[acyl-carrier protein] synthase
MTDFSIGTDLVDVAAVEAALASHGERYLERVYTPQEVLDCGERDPAPERLAGRFAAKEAAYKALGLPTPFLPRHVEVRLMPTGAPTLKLRGAIAAEWRRRALAPLVVSIAHEARFATAVVLAHRADA